MTLCGFYRHLIRILEPQNDIFWDGILCKPFHVRSGEVAIVWPVLRGLGLRMQEGSGSGLLKFSISKHNELANGKVLFRACDIGFGPRC